MVIKLLRMATISMLSNLRKCFLMENFHLLATNFEVRRTNRKLKQKFNAFFLIFCKNKNSNKQEEDKGWRVTPRRTRRRGGRQERRILCSNLIINPLYTLKNIRKLLQEISFLFQNYRWKNFPIIAHMSAMIEMLIMNRCGNLIV